MLVVVDRSGIQTVVVGSSVDLVLVQRVVCCHLRKTI